MISEYRPRIFIASSSEGKEIAHAIFSNLEDECEITPWDKGIFLPGEFTLESITNSMDGFDFGIFVFSPDDFIEIREERYKTVRDNVIFELGLFIGRLGRNRNFIVTPKNMKNMHILTDLSGLSFAQYDSERKDKNWESATLTATNNIKKQIKKIGKNKNKDKIWESERKTLNLACETDIKIYLSHIKMWERLSAADDWQDWSGSILGLRGEPAMRIDHYNNLCTLDEYLVTCIWPKKYNQLEESFHNFKAILGDFLVIFKIHTKKEGDSYQTEKIYKAKYVTSSEMHHELSIELEFHIALILDLMCELTRAANLLCEQFRNDIDPSYRIEKGILPVTSGDASGYTLSRIEYEDNIKKKGKYFYPGLKEFMLIREKRSPHYGKGINEKYLRKHEL